ADEVWQRGMALNDGGCGMVVRLVMPLARERADFLLLRCVQVGRAVRAGLLAALANRALGNDLTPLDGSPPAAAEDLFDQGYSNRAPDPQRSASGEFSRSRELRWRNWVNGWATRRP